MQVLLVKDVRKLGYVGDIVDVKAGYARNYLVPQLLATEPTEENIAAIQEAKKVAAAERARRKAEFEQLVARIGADTSVTIEVAANPEGTLYGSVGPREIAHALQAIGHAILPDHVMLDHPIRTLDNRMVTLEFTDEVTAQVKVWVVREGGAADEQAAAEQPDESAEGISDEEEVESADEA